MEAERQSSAEAEKKAIDIAPGLRLIRRRRWYLWAVILVYLPLMWSVLQIAADLMPVIFAAWFVILLAIALLAAVARCPRCGNYFHVNGMTFLCLRKCLHCQLHLTADGEKRAS